MATHYLGVDAGATKTHAIVATESGEVRGSGEGGPGNHEVFGYDAAAGCVRTAVFQAFETAGIGSKDLAYACFSMAGADIEADFTTLPARVIEPILGETRFLLKNDAFGCLRAGTHAPFGVMINCGTGQVAVGRNRAGDEVRLGGYGYDFGDFSGGSVIAFQAASAVMRADDGRGEPTALSWLLFAAAGTDSAMGFLEKTYRDQELFKDLNIPRIVFQASRDGDAVAKRIVLASAEEMAVTAVALIRRLGMEKDSFDLITAGSVFKGEDPEFLDTIRSLVHAVAPDANFRMPLYDPVVGAALLAMEEDGLEVGEAIHDQLAKFGGFQSNPGRSPRR